MADKQPAGKSESGSLKKKGRLKRGKHCQWVSE